MKTVIACVLFVYSSTCLPAQKTDTLTAAVRKYTSAEQVLQLPPAYTVLKCNIRVSTKRELFAVFYARDGSRYCLNSQSKDFNALWERMINMAAKGATITLEEVTVLKGDKEMKWMPKTFIVP